MNQAPDTSGPQAQEERPEPPFPKKSDKDAPALNTGARFRLAAINGMAWLLSKLGFGGLSMLGSGLGWLIWHLVPARRRLATTNIAVHLGMPKEQAARLAAASFRHSSRAFLEILLTKDFGLHSPRLHFVRPDLWQALCSSTRPAVATSAHMGAWELLASMLGEMCEAPRPRMVVVRRYPDPAVQTFITARREAKGATMIGHRTVASAVLRALRQNGIVAFLVDHNALRSEALFLPFLGEEAAVNMGPALLAVRTNALIWPIVLLRDGKNYVVHQQPPMDTALLSGTREEKVKKAALFYTQAAEDMVRACPEQWFWMHNRWKTRPAQTQEQVYSPQNGKSF